VLIECDGASFRLPIDDIEHAKLVPDWDAVMKGSSGVGRATDRGAPHGKPGNRTSQKRREPKPSRPPRRDDPHASSHRAPAADTAADAENKEQG